MINTKKLLYFAYGTKHILLFPSDPKECFEMAAQSFDLAEILQTPIIVMSDLDIGMNDWVVDPLKWDDKTKYNRGKVLNKKNLDDLVNWGRYLDVDGDGIPYRTLPGTHESKGSYFTRGTSHDAFAGYTEDGRINAENMMRITKKFKKSLKYLPALSYGQSPFFSGQFPLLIPFFFWSIPSADSFFSSTSS